MGDAEHGQRIQLGRYAGTGVPRWQAASGLHFPGNSRPQRQSCIGLIPYTVEKEGPSAPLFCMAI